MRDRPLSANLLKAKGRSHQITQLSAVWTGASASDFSEGVTNLISRRDVQVFQVEFALALKLWLPVAPTRAVRLSAFVKHWRQNIVDHRVRSMMAQHFIQSALARVLCPEFEYGANVIEILHVVSTLNDGQALAGTIHARMVKLVA